MLAVPARIDQVLLIPASAPVVLLGAFWRVGGRRKRADTPGGIHVGTRGEGESGRITPTRGGIQALNPLEGGLDRGCRHVPTRKRKGGGVFVKS